MRRREFIAAIAGIAASRPFAASAEGPRRSVPLVGIIWLGNPSTPVSLRSREAFQRGLRENGYVVGQNIAIEERFSADPEELRAAVEQLVRLNVDVISAAGTQAALAAKHATDTIPMSAEPWLIQWATDWLLVSPGQGEMSPATLSLDPNWGPNDFKY